MEANKKMSGREGRVNSKKVKVKQRAKNANFITSDAGACGKFNTTFILRFIRYKISQKLFMETGAKGFVYIA